MSFCPPDLNLWVHNRLAEALGNRSFWNGNMGLVWKCRQWSYLLPIGKSAVCFSSFLQLLFIYYYLACACWYPSEFSLIRSPLADARCISQSLWDKTLFRNDSTGTVLKSKKLFVALRVICSLFFVLFLFCFYIFPVIINILRTFLSLHSSVTQEKQHILARYILEQCT